jgi:hypothetical protein
MSGSKPTHNILPWEAHADWSFWKKVFELEFI